MGKIVFKDASGESTDWLNLHREESFYFEKMMRQIERFPCTTDEDKKLLGKLNTL